MDSGTPTALEGWH